MCELGPPKMITYDNNILSHEFVISLAVLAGSNISKRSPQALAESNEVTFVTFDAARLTHQRSNAKHELQTAAVIIGSLNNLKRKACYVPKASIRFNKFQS